MTKTHDIRRTFRRRPRSGPLTLKCKLCASRAQVQLCSEERAGYEMLCFEHLGEFLDVWADRTVGEWSVVVL